MCEESILDNSIFSKTPILMVGSIGAMHETIDVITFGDLGLDLSSYLCNNTSKIASNNSSRISQKIDMFPVRCIVLASARLETAVRGILNTGIKCHSSDFDLYIVIPKIWLLDLGYNSFAR